MTYHEFKINYFRKPCLCRHCEDYIWGTGHVGYKCKECGINVHSQCRIFLSKSNCAKTTTDANQIDFNESALSLDTWSKYEISDWLAVVNLHRYCEVFQKSHINGVKFLALNLEKLFEMRIRDTFHHKAIMDARDELLYRAHITKEQMQQQETEVELRLINNPYKPDRHYFLVATLSETAKCKICNRPLLGILYQGLSCQQCGMIVHRQCSCLGLPECKPIQRAKIMQYHVFGVSLFDLMSECVDAPALLIKAFDEIESRAKEADEDLYDVYRLSTETEKIERFKQQLNQNGVELTQFIYFDLNTIAAVVKAFLRELQDTVIPEEEYDRFCNSENLSQNDFRALVNGIHPLHLKCLKYIMKHLVRVWNYQFKQKNCHYLPDKLFHIFRTILMRPPWGRVMDITKNLDKQTQVIKRLLIDYDWEVQLPDYKHRPEIPPSPLSPPTSVIVNEPEIIQPERPPDLRTKQEILNESPWYWPDLSRDDTLVIMKDSKEGSFLIRNSSDKNADSVSPYTLCVMKGSNVKSVKIFYDIATQFYDIERPCRFYDIVELVSYYSINSLREYNQNLDVKLQYPLSKYEFGKTTEWNLDRLYSSFREAYHQYDNSVRKSEGLEVEIATLREDLNSKRLACEAYQQIIDLFNEQIDISNDNLLNGALPTVQKQQIALNIENINKRIDELKKNKQELAVDCDYLNTIIQQLLDELEQLRPDLIEMRKKRENYHMWLLQRGEDEDQIMKLLKSPQLPKNVSTSSFSSQASVASNDMYITKGGDETLANPHEISANWFSPNFDREKADELLSNASNGTYLIRPGSRSKYVLSIVHNNDIKHCLIDEDVDGCFIKTTDNTKSRRFPTLSHLVLHYSKNSLRKYNDTLDTCLIYPAFCDNNAL